MAHLAIVSAVMAVMRVLAGLILSISGTTGGAEVVNGPAMPEFDFTTLALGLGAVSLMLSGAIMAGGMLFPGISEKAKREYIPNTIVGLVIVGIASFIIGILTPA